MATNLFVYTLSTLIICSYLLSGIFIVSVRGIKPPMLYISLNRFAGALCGFVNLLQTAHTPLYGQVLWNPLHVLMSLTLYPLLFTYIFRMLRPGSTGVRFLLSTFLPAIVFTALYLSFEALLGKLPLFAGYADMRNYLDKPQLWVMFVATGFSVAMMCFFALRAINMLSWHRRNLESNFSYTQGSTLGWMWWAIGIALLQWCVVLTVIMFEGNIGQIIGLFLFIIEPIIVTVWILRQKDLYSNPVENEGHGKGIVLDRVGSDNVPELSLIKREMLKERLVMLLNKEEIFTNPELTKDKVREMMGTNRTYLSEIINRDMNTTFYQLINSYRLNKSVEMMRNSLCQNMSLGNIAEICGFKSQGAFSTFFKQTYGKTPAEWREEGSPSISPPLPPSVPPCEGSRGNRLPKRQHAQGRRRLATDRVGRFPTF